VNQCTGLPFTSDRFTRRLPSTCKSQNRGNMTQTIALKPKDYKNDVEPIWCPVAGLR